MPPPEPEAEEDDYDAHDEYYDMVEKAEQVQWCAEHKPEGAVPCYGGRGANM